MRKLIVFNHISLDGYFTDANNDMSFARNEKPDPEWDAFVDGNASSGGMLVFGRVTYQMMASFWPTPTATQSMPTVAEGMNRLPKVVFSRTLQEVNWNNTRLVKEDMLGEIRRLKQADGQDMVIFGSGKLIAQLAPQGLIDEYQIIVDPVVLGAGRTMFEGVKKKLSLTLKETRNFKNGTIFTSYVPG